MSINMYAYSYKAAIEEFADDGYMLMKVGDSHRDVDIRMAEQGRAAEWQGKVKLGKWDGLTKIDRDYRVHEILTRKGHWYKEDGEGNEWFKLPATSQAEAFAYIDTIITDLEGHKVRPAVKLRKLQEETLIKAMQYIADAGVSPSILASLCPRFGKTLWALTLYNRIHATYGNKVMLLPAYWLSSHTSFANDLDSYNDFLNMRAIDINDPNAESTAKKHMKNGHQIVIPISLHGDLSDWKKKHAWISKIPNDEIFTFADEGDFGTHTPNQVEKLSFIFNKNTKPSGPGKKCIRVYASGTNVQRLAKCSTRIDGILYTTYSQLEDSDSSMIRRKFYCTHVDELKKEVEKLDVKVMPSWSKIWGKPLANTAFIGDLFKSLTGELPLRNELNLSAMTDDSIDCFMMFVSANNKEMGQIKDIANRAIPDWHIKVLNGDYSSNLNAEFDTISEVNRARLEGKRGVIIIANQMGSRSYSVSAIQASVIAFDRGSVDATIQKVSRCLTPTNKKSDNIMFDGSADKQYGYIVDLSFDPNRSENIVHIILDEAVKNSRSAGTDDDNNEDFPKAVKFMLTTINLFKMNQYGHPVEVTEDSLFEIFGDNEMMLKVADVTIDVDSVVESGVFNILKSVKGGKETSPKQKTIVGEGVINYVTEGGNPTDKAEQDAAIKSMQEIINNAIKTLNMSATSVYNLSNLEGNSYRECLTIINAHVEYDSEFMELFGIPTADAIKLLDNKILNEPILDVIVRNSFPTTEDNLFV